MTGDVHFSLLLGFVHNFVNTVTSPVMVCQEEKNQCLVQTFRIHSGDAEEGVNCCASLDEV